MDIINLIKGASFKQIWAHKRTGPYGKQKVFFIGLQELIKNKKMVGRKQDFVDLELLLKRLKKKRF
jgi:hypothetical protein